MKHLIIFGIIILGVLLLKLSCQLNHNTDNFSEISCLNPGIYIDKSSVGGKYGRGVFANKNFTIDEIIEEAPFIEDSVDKYKGIAKDYVFNIKDEKVALAFGYASLYNHNDSPNAMWYFDNDRIVIKTKKPIQKGQEIFISYRNDYWKTRND